MYTLGKERPPIPEDEVHLPLRGRYEQCLSCHGLKGSNPRPESHPIGNDCLHCHRWAGERS